MRLVVWNQTAVMDPTNHGRTHILSSLRGVREARTLDLRNQDHSQFSYETYALANCATTPLLPSIASSPI